MAVHLLRVHGPQFTQTMKQSECVSDALAVDVALLEMSRQNLK